MRPRGRAGNVPSVKVWYHVIAAVVGLALAALIVYLVFGSASEQGAVQDGDAGNLAASEGLCGTIDVADTASADTRALAGANLPALFDQLGPIPAISDEQPAQQKWVERVHAAAGLCIDELRIETTGTTISMSTVDGVDDATASAYAAGALQQAFTPPFNPRTITLTSTVGDDGAERTIVVSNRAWRAFTVRRKALGLEPTIANLKQFRKASGFAPADLKIVGW